MGILGDAFRGAKSAGAGFAAKQFIRSYLAKYGELLDLDINSSSRNILFHFLPKGEKDNVLIKILGYEVTTQGAKTFVTIQRMEASREWISLLAQDFVVGRKIEVPEQYAAAIKMVL